MADTLLAHTGGRGAEVVYDAVGGVTTAAALASLAQRGRLVVISAVGTPTVEINLPDFYHREARMLGADSRKLDVTESAECLAVLTPTSSAASSGHCRSRTSSASMRDTRPTRRWRNRFPAASSSFPEAAHDH
ncbi:zinc-binding dehydrogenase [Streptomyces chiangmaiensis]